MQILSYKIGIILALLGLKWTLVSGADWNSSKISRSYFSDDDPWAVDRCPEERMYEVTNLEFPEDCTKWQKCWWIDSEKPQDTLVVHLASCYTCKKPECPEGRMIYIPDNNKCYPPNEILTTVNKCGTKEPPAINCTGPEDSDYIHRLGKSRFYLMQNEDGSNWVNWEEAKEVCKKAGLKLAKIDNIQTDVYVGRLLEGFIQRKGWIHNWYWLDAKFDRTLKTYVWQDTMKPLNYSNFFYRQPRPKGYGDFFDIEGNFISEPLEEHCLALAMPLPFPKSNPSSKARWGMHTSWWEKPCDSNKKGNVLCESEDPVCDDEKDDIETTTPYIEGSGYYYDSFWPVSNRRFVVNWNAKTFDEAKEICEKQNMVIYSPREGDDCLAKELKKWMKEVTAYTFWTDLQYKVATRTLVYPDGKEVPEERRNISNIQKRSTTETIEETCVSATWNYEQALQNFNFCSCTVSSVVLSPENCINPIGVICQHPDAESKPCADGLHPGTGQPMKKQEEFYEFDKRMTISRSAYKQPGNKGSCPFGYERLKKDEKYWDNKEYDYESSSYQYDFLSPYWMKPQNETCYLSTLTYDKSTKEFTQLLEEGNCNKALGFLICKMLPMGAPSGLLRSSKKKDPLAEEPLEFEEI